jgi:hypothetical protein
MASMARVLRVRAFLGAPWLAWVAWLAASPVLAAAAHPTPAPPTAPSAAPAPQVEVHIPPFAAPASMPALGEELARAMYAALRDANIPARLGKGDEGSALVGRLEEISQAQVRLHASYHGHSVQSVGDLEHLDDLVYAVFSQLRPRLQASVPFAPGPGPGDKEAIAAGPISGPVVTPVSVPAKDMPPVHPPHHHPETHPAGSTTAKKSEPIATPAGPSSPAPNPATPPTPVAEGPPSPATTPPATSPAPPARSPAELRRPRVAVHIVGDPPSRLLPPGYYGLGPVGQQTLINYLQQRLRVPAVASRLVGLTGGLSAFDQSLLLGARHTLMVRMDSLVMQPSPSAGPGLPAAATLAARIHLVLLCDGKLLLDRTVATQPALILPTEAPAQAYSRLLFAAIDSIASELLARIELPPPAPPG